MAIAWIDVVIISLVVLSAILSLFRGFVKEALALITWLVALWVAMAFYEELAAWLSQWIGPESDSICSPVYLRTVAGSHGQLPRRETCR